MASVRPVHALVHINTSDEPIEAAKLWMKHATELNLPAPTEDAAKWIDDLETSVGKDPMWVAFTQRRLLKATVPPRYAQSELSSLRQLLARRQSEVDAVVQLEDAAGKPAVEILIEEVKPFAERIAVLAFAHYAEGRLSSIDNAAAGEHRRIGRTPTIGKDGTQVVREQIDTLLSAARTGISVDSETRDLLDPKADEHCRSALKDGIAVTGVVESYASDLEKLATTSRMSPSITTEDAIEIKRVLSDLADPKRLAELCGLDLDEGGLKEAGKHLSLLGSHEANSREVRLLQQAIDKSTKGVETFLAEIGHPPVATQEEVDDAHSKMLLMAKGVETIGRTSVEGAGIDTALAGVQARYSITPFV